MPFDRETVCYYTELAKREGLAVLELLGGVSGLLRGGEGVGAGSCGFYECNFQLIMKYHIRLENLVCSDNHECNVLYLFAAYSFQIYPTCKLETFHVYKKHLSVLN